MMQTNFAAVLLIACGWLPPAGATASGPAPAASRSEIVRVFSWADAESRLHPAWKERRLDGRTLYHVVPAEGGAYVTARSSASASTLYQEFEAIPVRGLQLAWTWQVVEFPTGESLREKSGDDRAASVAVVFDKGFLPWQTKAIFYVWSESLPEGTVIPNPYTRNVRMIVVQSGEAPGWVHEIRDLAADYRMAFGEPATRIEGVGVLTDSDNTGSRAGAAYGPLWLSRVR